MDYIDIIAIIIMITVTLSWMKIERNIRKEEPRRKHNKNGR